MKLKLLLIMIVAILWVTVISDAVQAFLNHGLFAKENINYPQAEYQYTLNYIPTPNWWPH